MTSGAPDVLQATAWYPPYNVGGTEVYVASLVQELERLGFRSDILLPEPEEAKVEDGPVRLRTYPVAKMPNPEEMSLGLPHADFGRFVEHLRERPGAIYHQHSWTRGCGAHHLRAARNAGLRTILTVHVPSNICLRGTMARMGVSACDGLVEERRCGACWAQSRGLPDLAAEVLASLPLPFASRMRRSSGRLATAMSARALGAAKEAELHDMVANADKVVVVCQWLYDAMLRNNVDPDKLVLSRQGLPREFISEATKARREERRPAEPLKLLFLGRFHPVKGLNVVINAVRALPPEVEVRLSVHGVASTQEEQAHAAVLRNIAEGDHRIRFKEPVSRLDVSGILAAHDVLVIPSLWLETGPLVALEAVATGTFVLGSDLGGVAELVGSTSFGKLAPPGDVGAWARAIAELSASPPARLSVPRSEVRSMQTVASEMAALYRSL